MAESKVQCPRSKVRSRGDTTQRIWRPSVQVQVRLRPHAEPGQDEVCRRATLVVGLELWVLDSSHPTRDVGLRTCYVGLFVQSFRSGRRAGFVGSSLLFDLDLTIGSLNCSAPDLADHTWNRASRPRSVTGLANRPLLRFFCSFRLLALRYGGRSMPQFDSQTSHFRHQRFIDPLSRGQSAKVLSHLRSHSHPAPRCLVEDLADPRRSLVRNVSLPIRGFPALVARRRQAQVARKLPAILEPLHIPKFRQERQRRQRPHPRHFHDLLGLRPVPGFLGHRVQLLLQTGFLKNEKLQFPQAALEAPLHRLAQAASGGAQPLQPRQVRLRPLRFHALRPPNLVDLQQAVDRVLHLRHLFPQGQTASHELAVFPHLLRRDPHRRQRRSRLPRRHETASQLQRVLLVGLVLLLLRRLRHVARRHHGDVPSPGGHLVVHFEPAARRLVHRLRFPLLHLRRQLLPALDVVAHLHRRRLHPRRPVHRRDRFLVHIQPDVRNLLHRPAPFVEARTFTHTLFRFTKGLAFCLSALHRYLDSDLGLWTLFRLDRV